MLIAGIDEAGRGPLAGPVVAAAVILDRNSNGRREWKVVESRLSYHEWQEQKSATGAPA